MHGYDPEPPQKSNQPPPNSAANPGVFGDAVAPPFAPPAPQIPQSGATDGVPVVLSLWQVPPG
jgi:hypothetical protein